MHSHSAIYEQAAESAMHRARLALERQRLLEKRSRAVSSFNEALSELRTEKARRDRRNE